MQFYTLDLEIQDGGVLVRPSRTVSRFQLLYQGLQH